ncbi:hypothetical protein LCGC14_1707250, partial [marine sediment metagenome]
MARKYPKQNLVFPVLGLHEGVGYDIQPPGTTADALNVRGYDSLKQRLRGGRRPGQSKWHSAQINGSEPIQLLQKVIQAREPALSAVTPATSFADYAVAASSPDFLGDWVSMNHVTSSRSTSEGIATTWAIEAGLPKAAVVDTLSGGTARKRFLKSGYRTTRDMTIQFIAKPTTVGGESVDDVILGMGVMFRSDVAGYGYFNGSFRLVSTDKVKFVIDRIEGLTTTTGVAESATFTVSGSTTPTDGLTVRIDWTDDEIVSITIAWSDSTEQSTDAQWLGTTFTLTDSTNFVGDAYAYGGPMSWKSVNTIGERRITNIAVTFEKPNTPNILFTIEDDDSTTADRYELPDGWSRWDVSSSGVVSDQEDGPTSNASFFEPSVDTTSGHLRGTLNFAAAAARSFIRRTAVPTVNQAIELRFTNDGRNSGTNEMAAVFAVSDDLDRYVAVSITATGGAGSRTNMVGDIDQVTITVFGSSPSQVVWIAANDAPGSPVVHTKDGSGHWFRVTFDGSVIRISIEGQEWLTYTLTAGDLTNLGYTSLTVPVRNAIGFKFGHQARIVEFVEGEQQAIQDQLVIVAGGTIKVIADGVLSTPTGGSAALSTALYRAQVQAAYGRVFFVDGDKSKAYRFSTDAVTDWTATAG